jgi:galactose-1-phosphate uridylyltransferase
MEAKMICDNCGVEYSDDVYTIHRAWCVKSVKKQEPANELEPVIKSLSKPELKSILDEAGVKYTARMGKEDLQKLVDTIATGEKYIED